MLLVHPTLRRVLAVSAVFICAVAVTGCQSGSSTHGGGHERIKSDPNEAFSSKEYGVAASPRVTDLKVVRKGGGRSQVGKPYKVRGKWYYPKDQPGYVKSGKASWYGSSFHGRLTANGEVYDMFGLSAAHPTFPLPSYAKVTNLKTGTSLMVRVNDRGPYAHGRVMDLSSRAADLLGYKQEGIGDVKVEYVGRAPTEGDDTKMLMASYRPGPGANPLNDGMASGVMVASNESGATRQVYSSAMTGATPAGLPGVRAQQAIGQVTLSPAGGASEGSLVNTDGMSVGSIIENASQPAFAAPSYAPVPTPRADPYELVVSSYAPARAHTGAAGALTAIAAGREAGERIEIGLLEDRAMVDAIRDIADGHGRLVVDAGAPEIAGSVSLALEANPSEDVDALLQAIWQAGAEEAFVLHD